MASKKSEKQELSLLGQRKEELIGEIQDSILVLFDQADKMLELSIICLEQEMSKKIALDIIEEDQELDSLQGDLLIEINNFIIREQPIAKDLRFALGCNNLSFDLERMGDYTKNFAKSLIKVEGDFKGYEDILLQIMKILQDRLRNVRELFINYNHKQNKILAKGDEQIDDLVRNIFSQINTDLVNEENRMEIKKLTRVYALAKIFERYGDHLVNLCEILGYIEKGKLYHFS